MLDGEGGCVASQHTFERRRSIHSMTMHYLYTRVDISKVVMISLWIHNHLSPMQSGVMVYLFSVGLLVRY